MRRPSTLIRKTLGGLALSALLASPGLVVLADAEDQGLTNGAQGFVAPGFEDPLPPIDDGGGVVVVDEPPVASGCRTAEVVALDQVYFWNRIGAFEPQGQMYALKHDVVSDSQPEAVCGESKQPLVAGSVRLRKNKRPRPLVLRVNVGQCLDIVFTNLLKPTPDHDNQPSTRKASVHVVGLNYRVNSTDGGLWLGTDANGQVASGGSITYRLYPEKEGTYLLYNGAVMTGGGEGEGGTISTGLFGAINVEPASSRYFRSQVTEEELRLATVGGVVDYTKTFGTLPNYATDLDLCFHASSDPVLEMVNASNAIIHSDLTAIVTGPTLGGTISPPAGITSWADFPVYSQEPAPADRADRLDGFREFTIIFHDEVGALQAFPHFEDRVLSHTLHSVRDAFAINYGTGGAGAEILANRLGVGPMWDCIDCKYEEFFLTSWAVGDPAMVVDKPANWPCGDNSVIANAEDKLSKGLHTECMAQLALPANKGRKATKALYPDDPSNVYHSYMNDNVRFRNLHAGSEDHHIFHLHAHQWLRTPNSDKSAYLDSQAIGQGSSFTYEIAHGGSGNLNKTVGDSIFHCHFYPHFAQGMWGMWRVHDVYEKGTALDANGRPTAFTDSAGKVYTTARALPDGEIKVGSPIPALVPIPGEALPPTPTATRLVDGQIDATFTNSAAQTAKAIPGNQVYNPGYPFYVPGVAGHRPPHPPLDFAVDPGTGQRRDGGLPRHVIVSDPAQDATAAFDRLRNTKVYNKMRAFEVPEAGTALEQIAMATHAQSSIGGFLLNGRPAVSGAPFADPCPVGASQRYYKAADIQLDAKFTKDGWHFNQQRIITLVSDVPATLAGTRPPEPFFFRANSRDCINYELTNLVPYEYMNDDFQVRTPTDIIAQHIHLVKFDVTSSDGGGNGFNYEDGTFAPEEVQERIHAIRAINNCPAGFVQTVDASGQIYCPEATADPRFGNGPDVNCDEKRDYLGAQTTVQRWYADPQLDLAGSDRTLRTVFTHDHFGPSTHQQVGLYAGLIIEPQGSSWYHNESGAVLGATSSVSTGDGSPTSWQARIETNTKQTGPFREFLMEFSDFQLAYEREWPVGGRCPDPVLGWANPTYAINAPGREDVGPHDLYVKPTSCPVNHNDTDGSLVSAFPSVSGDPNTPAPPCPEAVSAADPGFSVINYRAEPLAARIKTPGSGQTSGPAGDLSFAYESRVDRANPEYNKLPYWTGNVATGTQYFPYPPLTGGLVKGDPVTPLLRVYEGDKVKIRTLVGGFEEEHSMVVHANRWLFEPDDPASGYKGSQMNGISEWFDLELPPIPFLQSGKVLDMLYKPSAAAEWQWNGLWGIIRVGRTRSIIETDFGPLSPLSTNDLGEALTVAQKASAYDVASSEELVPTDLDPTGLVEATPVARPVPGSEETPVLVEGVSLVGAADISDAADLSPSLRIYPYPPTPAPVPISCPIGTAHPTLVRSYDIAAVAAREVLPSAPTVGKSLVYNARATTMNHWGPLPASDVEGWNGTVHGPLHDPTAILFVPFGDLNFVGGRPRLNANAPVEPLILRARAGECVRVRLINLLPKFSTGWTWGYDQDGWNGWHMLYQSFNANDVKPSMDVSLHPQMLYYDPARSDGSNVGINPAVYGKQSVSPNNLITYYWYAGAANKTPLGTLNVVPIEFGATGLTSSDPLKHTNKGAIGALIIEPASSSWAFTDIGPYLPTEPATRVTRASATVTKRDGTTFREFVAIFQNDVNLRYADSSGLMSTPTDPLSATAQNWKPVENLWVLADPTESAQKAFNYRTEPVWFRMGYSPNTPATITKGFDFANVFTNAKVGGPPVTPIFRANAGSEVRFRVVEPGGHTQAHVWEIAGHVWPERPYSSNSTVMEAQVQSQWQGSRYGVGPGHHSDSFLVKAGGSNAVPAQYMYKDYVGWGLASGLWGVFAVGVPFP